MNMQTLLNSFTKVKKEDYRQNQELANIVKKAVQLRAQIQKDATIQLELNFFDNILQIIEQALQKKETFYDVLKLAQKTKLAQVFNDAYNEYYFNNKNIQLIDKIDDVQKKSISIAFLRRIYKTNKFKFFVEEIKQFLFTSYYISESDSPFTVDIVEQLNFQIDLEVDMRFIQQLNNQQNVLLQILLDQNIVSQHQNIINQIIILLEKIDLHVIIQHVQEIQQIPNISIEEKGIMQSIADALVPYVKMKLTQQLSEYYLKEETYKYVIIYYFFTHRRIFGLYLKYLGSIFDKNKPLVHMNAMKIFNSEAADIYFCAQVGSQLCNVQDCDSNQGIPLEAPFRLNQLTSFCQVINQHNFGILYLCSLLQYLISRQMYPSSVFILCCILGFPLPEQKITNILSQQLQLNQGSHLEQSIQHTIQIIYKKEIPERIPENVRKILLYVIPYIKTGWEGVQFYVELLKSALVTVKLFSFNLINFYKIGLASPIVKQRMELFQQQLTISGDFEGYEDIFDCAKQNVEQYYQLLELLKKDSLSAQEKQMLKQCFIKLFVHGIIEQEKIQHILGVLLQQNYQQLQLDQSLFQQSLKEFTLESITQNLIENDDAVYNFFITIQHSYMHLIQFYQRGSALLNLNRIGEILTELQIKKKNIQKKNDSQLNNSQSHGNQQEKSQQESTFDVQQEQQEQQLVSMKTLNMILNINEFARQDSNQQQQSIKIVNEPQNKVQEIQYSKIIVEQEQQNTNLDTVSAKQQQSVQLDQQEQIKFEEIKKEEVVESKKQTLNDLIEQSDLAEQNIKQNSQNDAEIKKQEKENSDSRKQDSSVNLSNSLQQDLHTQQKEQIENQIRQENLEKEKLEIEESQKLASKLVEKIDDQPRVVQLHNMKEESEDSDQVVSQVAAVVLQQTQFKIDVSHRIVKEQTISTFQQLQISNFQKITPKNIQFEKSNIIEEPIISNYGKMDQIMNDYYQVNMTDYQQTTNKESAFTESILKWDNIRQRTADILNLLQKSKEIKFQKQIKQVNLLKPFCTQIHLEEINPICSICGAEINNLMIQKDIAEETPEEICKEERIGIFCFYLNKSFCTKCNQSKQGYNEIIFQYKNYRVCSAAALSYVYADISRPIFTYKELIYLKNHQKELAQEIMHRRAVQKICKRFQFCDKIDKLIKNQQLYILYPYMLKDLTYSLRDVHRFFYNQTKFDESKKQAYEDLLSGCSVHADVLFYLVHHIESCNHCAEVINKCCQCQKNLGVDLTQSMKGVVKCKYCFNYCHQKCAQGEMCKDCAKLQ